MHPKRILLMHISNISGHRAASAAIEKALRQADEKVQIQSINAFNFVNPLLEKLIDKLYKFTIQHIPMLWDCLYDNLLIYKIAKKVRALIHRLHDKKIKRLLESFSPNIVVCTQAFPCGMVADFKHRHGLKIPLVGVLTDYAPHVYWLNDAVDIYIVPHLKIKQMFIQRGVSSQRLIASGIPIDSKFNRQSNREEVLRQWQLDANLPIILVMGGAQGLGPIKDITLVLDKLSLPCQLIIVCGVNKRIYNWLDKNRARFTKPIRILGYTEQINDLMAVASFIVTKPGGITTAEALSKSLPLIIFKPLPGQENRNTDFLLETKAAITANGFNELKSQTEALLSNTGKLDELRKRAGAFARPDSSSEIAHFILGMIN